MFDQPLVFVVLLGGGIFALAGAIQRRFPPKKINHFYGYRTSRSMNNQTAWDFAQRYSAQKMMRLGLGMVAFALLVGLVDLEWPQPWGVWIGIVIIVVAPLLMLLQVENELKKRFPKE